MAPEVGLGSSPPAPNQSGAKRRKTREKTGSRAGYHQACAACKARKVRCDSLRPRCSYCTARSIDCEYPPLFKRALCSQAHVTALENRLAELEAQATTGSGVGASSGPHGLGDARSTSREEQLSGITRPAADPGFDEPSPYPQEETGGIDSRGELVRGQDAHTFDPRLDPARNELSHGQATLRSNDIGALAPDQTASQQQYAPHELQREPVDTLNSYNPQVASGANAAADENEAVTDSIDGSERGEDIPVMDGMVGYEDELAEAREGDVFYGDSSSLHFAMSVKASAIAKDDREIGRNEAASRNGSTSLGREGAPRPERNNSLQPSHSPDHLFENVSLSNLSFQYLPQRHMANSLVDRYFAAVHPVWPFLLEDATKHAFEETWSSEKPVPQVWSAQLNLIFALGFEFWEGDLASRLPSQSAISVGNEFYLRARSFVLGNAFNISSISMVQSLLLMVQYQQGTMQSEQCWLTIGHATRMAQGLGLHKSEKRNILMSPLEEELRNRLWWGCFSLDRVSSMIYGRPTGIHHSQAAKQQYNFPKAIDDEYLNLGQSQPDNVPSLYAFYHYVAKLYCVVDEVLELLYEVTREGGSHDPACTLDGTDCHSHNSRNLKASSISATIIQMDSSLLSWHNSLPAFLKFCIDNPTAGGEQHITTQRQKNILRYRFLGIRILIHRQALLYLLQPPDKRQWLQNTQQRTSSDGVKQRYAAGNGTCSPFESSFAQLSARVCVSSAELLIEAVSLGRPLSLSGAWWWDFYFIFNSLCVIFGAMNLQGADLAIVIPETSRTTNLIERGFENIHAMAVIGGPKATKSENFLKKLMAATIRGAKKSNKKNNYRRTASSRTVHSLPNTCQPSPAASLQPENTFDGMRGGNSVNVSRGIDSETIELADWRLDLSNFPSLWEPTGVDYMDAASLDSDYIEAMFQTTFDLGGNTDDMPGYI